MVDTAHSHAVHEPPSGFIRKYIFSKDHKVIGIQYYLLALFSVFVGMALSILIRLNLAWSGTPFSFLETLFPQGAPGGVMLPEFYLAMLTMHGTIMVFMVLTTAPQGGFGNYFLPLQIGALDMAFPTLNMLSFWLTFVSLIVLLAAFFVAGGPPISGWTAYAPLSAIGEVAGPGLGTGQDLWIWSIAIFCVASLLGAINFITTTLDLRARGMTLMRMPLTCWSWFVTAILGLLAFGVLLSAGVLLLLDRLAGTSFFVPAGLVVSEQMIDHKGGSPLLWQHLFWFFGHPEVYIAILPAMGVTSQVLSVFSRKPIFGYRAMVCALFAIGILGFMVWGHHMFMSGMSPYSAIAFSLITTAIAVPSAIKTFNWLGTLWGGRIHFDSPMLFAIGFVSLFVSGGLGGLFLNQPSTDVYLHDTYFVVGHFHLVMGCCVYLWNLHRDLLLVPENVRPPHERRPGEGSFLDHLCWCQCHLYAYALSGHGGPSSSLSGAFGVQLSRRTPAAAHVHHDLGFPDDRRPVHLPLQFLLVTVQGPEGRNQSLECNNARVGSPITSASRQLW